MSTLTLYPPLVDEEIVTSVEALLSELVPPYRRVCANQDRRGGDKAPRRPVRAEVFPDRRASTWQDGEKRGPLGSLYCPASWRRPVFLATAADIGKNRPAGRQKTMPPERKCRHRARNRVLWAWLLRWFFGRFFARTPAGAEATKTAFLADSLIASALVRALPLFASICPRLQAPPKAMIGP